MLSTFWTLWIMNTQKSWNKVVVTYRKESKHVLFTYSSTEVSIVCWRLYTTRKLSLFLSLWCVQNVFPHGHEVPAKKMWPTYSHSPFSATAASGPFHTVLTLTLGLWETWVSRKNLRWKELSLHMWTWMCCVTWEPSLVNQRFSTGVAFRQTFILSQNAEKTNKSYLINNTENNS